MPPCRVRGSRTRRESKFAEVRRSVMCSSARSRASYCYHRVKFSTMRDLQILTLSLTTLAGATLQLQMPCPLVLAHPPCLLQQPTGETLRFLAKGLPVYTVFYPTFSLPFSHCRDSPFICTTPLDRHNCWASKSHHHVTRSCDGIAALILALFSRFTARRVVSALYPGLAKPTSRWLCSLSYPQERKILNLFYGNSWRQRLHYRLSHAVTFRLGFDWVVWIFWLLEHLP